MKGNPEVCIGCGLDDPLVEAGGIWYCPNPFCNASGATNWKRANLSGFHDKGSYAELVHTNDWLEKGMAVINKLSYEAGQKIMALKATQEVIEELKLEAKR
jgi:hypothetical protein